MSPQEYEKQKTFLQGMNDEYLTARKKHLNWILTQINIEKDMIQNEINEREERLK